MAIETLSSTVTIDTDEWKYVDQAGNTHSITNASTFVLTLTHDSVGGDVQYSVLPGQIAFTTDTGYTVKFHPEAVTDGMNSYAKSSIFTDAMDAVTNHNVSWTLPMSCSSTGTVQMWRAEAMKMSNVDFNAAGTLTSVVFTDQFGNTMTLPGTGSGITVGQAA